MPILVASSGGYKPNPGESNQSILVTLVREDNNSVHAISVESVRIDFKQDTKGGDKASSAVSNIAGWVVDTGNTDYPTAAGDSGWVTFIPDPAGAGVELDGSDAVQLDFNINRFEDISNIKVTGSANGMPLEYEFVPTKLA
ncbi:hypothetical protein [Demequina rhizosphaerae]|uniref:hypothetical protein n=1 Tax=Demequina rhizosphaerae TaxID=1638985 RepID=UPI000785D68A|nr:hypothetical protein [Demequina rhizosphaerae]